MVIKLGMLGMWTVLVPLGIGYFGLKVGKTKEIRSFGYALCLGYILMWALFQLIAVPFVLKAGDFLQVELVFELLSLTLAISGALLLFLQAKAKGDFRKNGRNALKRALKALWCPEGMLSLFLWGVFAAGLLFQAVQAYRLAYADGDDAYYIPVSTAANLGGGMYAIDSYTGAPIPLDIRHGLAPFPLWISFIAAKCGVNAAVAAHSLIPLALIPITYVLYLEIGRLLCGDVLSGREGRWPGQKTLLPLFMIFVSLLQIFGNYSIYPASTFLLTRTRQGKAALGNIILPFFLLLLYRIAEEVKERGRACRRNVFWLMAAMTAGCLCSTMAGFLCGMLVMLTAGLLFLLYRRPYILWQGFCGCLPGLAYALLYLCMK